MPDLLQIGGITDDKRDRLEAAIKIHKLADGDYPADANTHVATNGHDGVPAEVMSSLPNLAMMSCYGVGFVGIEVETAKSRGMVVTLTPIGLNAEVATTSVMLLMGCYRLLLRD